MILRFHIIWVFITVFIYTPLQQQTKEGYSSVAGFSLSQVSFKQKQAPVFTVYRAIFKNLMGRNNNFFF